MRALVTLCMIAILMAACANYKQHKTIQLSTPNASIRPIEHELFLVGDAGEETEIQKRSFKLLRKKVAESEVPVTVLFLGDNIYPVGMPSEKHPEERKEAESIMLSQMEIVADLGAEVIFVPGNHDWKQGAERGLKAIKRQGKFIEDYANTHIRMLPENGCPGPEVVELTEDCVLLLIDSQWWLQNWSREKRINEGCDIRTRFEFVEELTNTIRDYKEKQIIIAMHHPVISSGSHGGYFTFKDHMFPLTKITKNLYIPLPVVGSIYPIYRSTYGNVQDEGHPKYSEFIRGLLFAVEQLDDVVFVSGHEHSLEYNEDHGHHFLVSGSGSRLGPIGNPGTMQYGHAVPGFMQLDIRRGGGVDLAVWEPDENGLAGESAFEATLVNSREIIEDEEIGEVESVEFPDSTTTFISADYAKSKFYRFMWGERYRALYEIPVTIRNLDLSSEKSGLTPIKKGGGLQTNSLRFESDDGHEYVMRSLNKDATRLLPEIFQSTFASDILQDQFTATHPYAPSIIPLLADAAGIYHTNPETVYLPIQKKLGRYNDDFANAMYLYEERPSGDWTGYESFGGCDHIVSFNKVVEETIEDYRQRVDQEFVLRSRLFDMFIADWDRHDDQWRWAEFKTRDGKYFRPIPRDRDQALSDYDGFLISLISAPSTRRMSPLSSEIKRIKWFNFNGRYFDRDFTNEMTKEQWISVAKELQTRLTDEVIENSVKSWPKEIYAFQGEEIIQILKDRRENLPEFASRYYDELAKKIFIRGTENADYFEIVRGDHKTIVRVFDSNKEGDKRDLYYEREFYDSETQTMEIYGLDGQDNFVIKGDGRSSIKMYLVGGEGKDEFRGIAPASSGVRTFDTHKPESGMGVRYKEVDDDFNTYDRTAFKYNFAIPIPKFGWNPDDGLLLGSGVQFTRYGFKKAPYASKHSISAFYALGSKSFGIGYLGKWKEVFGRAGLELDATYEGQSYVENFFGFGNDSEQLVDDITFYRVRKRSFRIIPALTFGEIDKGHSFKLRLGMQSHRVDSTEGRFITDPDNGLPDDVFLDRRFVVGRIEYEFTSLDNPLITSRGIRFKASTGFDQDFSDEFKLDKAYRFFKTSLALYYKLKLPLDPVFATRVGAEWAGGDYQFYQGARLGANENFRGMFRQRFVGDKTFYLNTDLRINLANWRSYYLPAKMGISLGFDYGRVWLNEEDSNTWHYAYGGGVWISPFQTLLLSLGYYVSDVDKRFELGTSFFF
jgi:calcineurin-like phosphoesterase family protein